VPRVSAKPVKAGDAKLPVYQPRAQDSGVASTAINDAVVMDR
jgi:hypothetical protein